MASVWVDLWFRVSFLPIGLLLQRELGVCPGVLACFGFIFWLGE